MSGRPPIAVSEADWPIIRNILRVQVPSYTVWAFGSRATGRAKPYSDLDLAINGGKPLGIDLAAQLAEAFAESDLPYKVDIVDWAAASENFRKVIERDRVVVQTGMTV
ncbi:nucleotidyltransferase family protein [Nitrosomonas oligotropha]|uniref:nucleotidyltransferase family protein n=1 Tax=Nitrosomonas oligotropha TaxID=42354 RepID=UPI001370FAAF|nr:nucleotidyltransferase domain-containing protein [Nitrosomonas oligotropha]MXS81835.1 nucleotidyltransferase domain-containing protein [Nitrosomonas oligotropha]